MNAFVRPRRLLAVGIALLLVAGCAAPVGTAPVGTAPVGGGPTPGCPNTDWTSYKGLTDLPVPPGLTISSASRSGVQVMNATAKPWTVRVEWWSNMMCFGWTASEGAYSTIAAGASQTLAVSDPGQGAPQSRIGVVFWDHAVSGNSPGPATGFAWAEVPQASASN